MSAKLFLALALAGGLSLQSAGAISVHEHRGRPLASASSSSQGPQDAARVSPDVGHPSKLQDPDAHPEYSFAHSVQDARTGDVKRQTERRRAGVVLGSYSLVEADGSRRTVQYSADPLNGFTAVVRRDTGGAALFVKAPAGPGGTYGAPTISYGPPEPVLRFAYATPAYAVDGGENLKSEPAVVLVPSATPRPDSDPRILSLGLQTAEDQPLQQAQLVFQRDYPQDLVLHTTAPPPLAPPPPPPAPVVERGNPSSAQLLQVLETNGRPASSARYVSIDVQRGKSESQASAAEQPVVNIGGPRNKAPTERVRVQALQPLQAPVLFNAHHFPVLAINPAGPSGPTAAPFFLIGQPVAQSVGQHSADHAPQRALLSFPVLQYAPAPQQAPAATSAAPPNGSPIRLTQSDAPVHYATAPGYTSAVFTAFSNPFVSYAY